MITIIDYKAGNIASIQNMLKKVGVTSVISDKADEIRVAEKLILPGVGHFDHGMEKLQASGLIGVLNQRVLEDKVPILGICLGLQLFTRGSEEGSAPGLGWFAADTVRFNLDKGNEHLKIPHMGWSDVKIQQEAPLFQSMPPEPRYYFVHAYHIKEDNKADVMVEADYGYTFTAGLQKDNIFGVQFHPEKSHKFGMQLLTNFANL